MLGSEEKDYGLMKYERWTLGEAPCFGQGTDFFTVHSKHVDSNRCLPKVTDESVMDCGIMGPKPKLRTGGTGVPRVKGPV